MSSNGVDPSKAGGGFMGLVRSLPGKVNAMWNRKKVSNENNANESSTFSQLKSKISSVFRKKEGASIGSDVKLKSKSIKNSSPDTAKPGLKARIQKLIKRDSAKTELSSEQPASESPSPPVDLSKFNKRWDHMPASVKEEFKQRSNDPAFILSGAKQSPSPSAWLLRAGDHIKNDPSFVAQALKIDPAFAKKREGIDAISPEVLKDDKVTGQFKENIKYQNRGFAQNENAAKNLQFAPFDIAAEYLEEHPEAFKFANDTVRGDPEVVKQVLKNDPRQIEFVSWDEMLPGDRQDVMQAHEDLESRPAYYQFAPREWIANNIDKVEGDLKTYNGQDALQRIAVKLSQADYDSTRFVSMAKENRNLFEALIQARLLSYTDVRAIVAEKKEFESQITFKYLKEALMKGE